VIAAQLKFLILGYARVYSYKKKIFHSLESDSARNNIHPNNKQKPEITNKNNGKITCQYGQPG